MNAFASSNSEISDESVVTKPITFSVDEKLRIYLEKVMGFDLSRIDLNAVVNSLIRVNGEYTSFDDFAAAVSSQIAVHETYFLRHHEQFEWIEKFWLPEMLLSKGLSRAPIRILSAGCSTGEEPYSLYAHLYPLVEPYGIHLEIDAVDVCEKALDTAEKGRYGLWSMRGVDQAMEVSWLEVKSRNVEVKDWVKKGVNFFRHNLTQGFQTHLTQHYDLILCRNVMIYMHLEAVNKIYTNLLTVLKAEGFLMPGPSDPSPMGMSDIELSWENGVRLYSKNANKTDIKPVQYKVDSPALVKPIVEKLVERQVQLNILRNAPQSNDINNYATVDELLRTCQYDSARKMLEANVAIDPLDARSYVMLAVLALDLNDMKLAAHATRKALFLRPDAPYVVYVMANYKQKMGDFAIERKELAIVKKQLDRFSHYAAVEFCEEITIEQLLGVVNARLT